ncbi:MAG: AlbA family DNA-binding domain-containing protein [Bacillota bacterium]
MDKIYELIEYGYECEYLDFKEKQYSKEKNVDLIADIMAMANSRHEGDKFIIVGVKDRPEGKEIKGIDPEEFVDSSNYIQVILSNIEPDIHFDYFKYEYKGSVLGVFRIYNTDNKPYMLKKKYERLNEGYCLVRKGSVNALAKRSDFDYMYLNKGQFEIRFLEETLHAVHDVDGCASIEVALSNTTELPITIIAGELFIHDKHGEKTTNHPVYGLDRFVGADFNLALTPKSEVVGRLFVGFSSSHPLRLNIDEDGLCEDEYDFELLLLDARQKKYSAVIRQGRVFADGDFLWKVKKQKGIPHKFRTHR